jgi:hypothetical protein
MVKALRFKIKEDVCSEIKSERDLRMLQPCVGGFISPGTAL